MAIRSISFLASLIVLVACGDINVPADDDQQQQVCVVNVVRCNDAKTSVEICSQDGTGFLFAAECKSTETCDAGTCVPNAGGSGTCTQGWKRCSIDGASVQICTPAGKWIVESECKGGCSGGAC